MAKRLVWAEVVALGANVRAVEAGDLVLFSPEDRYEVEVQGCDYIMLRERLARRRGRTHRGVDGVVPMNAFPGHAMNCLRRMWPLLGWRLVARTRQTGTRMQLTDDDLAFVTFNADGLVPAIAQDVDHAARC